MRFSIVIPTYNRPHMLKTCLAGVVALDYSRAEFEVIVVDDGSPTSPEEIIHEFKDRLDVTLLQQENRGPGSARNLGAGRARGAWLAFLDDDCVPRPHWLRHMERATVEYPHAMLGGRTRNACSGNSFAQVNQLLVSSVVEWLRINAKPLSFFPTNNLLLPAAAFSGMGGFNAGLSLAGGEDRELCARWVAGGGTLIDVPEAEIDHYHPQTLRTFLAMHVRYGRGAARFHRSRRSNPLRFGTNGLQVTLLQSAWASEARALHTVLLIAAQAAEAAGFAIEAVGAALHRRDAPA